MRFFILPILSFLVPTLALAADTTILGGPIVPACETWGGICQACDVITLIDNILKFMVAFTTVIATLMFLYAGILYVTAAAKPANIDAAKKIFTTVLFGFVIVLSAWLIIDAAAREKLLAAGVTIESSGNCTDRGNSTCTSLEGIPAATVDKIIAMKKACNCDIVITGGTEVGHISHRPGQPRVDIRFSQATADYIKANRQALGITAICTTAGDAAYRYNCTYSETERHLHLQF